VSAGSRYFVLAVFSALGLSFIATTGVLFFEFGGLEATRPLHEQRWFSLAVFYSHLFIFFPTFGIIALIAFYIPASVFVDMYWHHVPHLGRTRLIAGGIFVVLASYFVAQQLVSGDQRSIWEIKPQVLASDPGEPAGCATERRAQCSRLPVMTALENVRAISSSRVGLSPFIRNCQPDTLIQRPSELDEKRFWLSVQHEEAGKRSLTGWVHTVLLPFKIFFLLVLLAVGLLLVARHNNIYSNYAHLAGRLERGVLVGALVMLPWPAMNHAFFKSNDMLFGGDKGSVLVALGPGLSMAYGAWGLILLLYFYRRHEAETEMVTKIGGFIVSGLAILKYDLLIDVAVRLFGSGANLISVGGLVAAAVLAAFVFLKRRPGRDAASAGAHGPRIARPGSSVVGMGGERPPVAAERGGHGREPPIP